MKNMIETKEGYEIELWRNFELVNSEESISVRSVGEI